MTAVRDYQVVHEVVGWVEVEDQPPRDAMVRIEQAGNAVNVGVVFRLRRPGQDDWVKAFVGVSLDREGAAEAAFYLRKFANTGRLPAHPYLGRWED